MILPNRAEIDHLHQKYAPSDQVYAFVWLHSQIVAAIAAELIIKNHLSLDKKFIEVASLLHDIGAYRFIDQDSHYDNVNYIRHGVVGEEILRAEGFGDRLALIASHHTGLGLTKEEIIARQLPLPQQDFVDETDEQTLVMYADKFHTKPGQLNSLKFTRAYLATFGPKPLRRFNQLVKHFGVPDLTRLATRFHQPIK